MNENREDMETRDEAIVTAAAEEAGQTAEENNCVNETESEETDGEKGVGDIDALLAEAEQRGYLRGRNERIGQLMEEPGLLERDSNVAPAASPGEEKVEILRHRRISIWDL
ncbi:MAG: hypothetical protein HDS68_01940 [Bacteroidales bacterium]|nr:hypothetical protein [Bacteroidales bacterium]